MKKNKVYILWIVFLIILIILSIYNYFHISVDEDNAIYKGKIIGINTEYEYNENSQYIESYSIELQTKNDGNINIKLNDNQISEYKENDKVNYYEDKGEYFITKEKATSNPRILWIILPVCETIVAVVLGLKMIKNRE